MTRSPYRAAVPHASHWRVAIDLGGMPGRIRSSARVLPGPLPSARTLEPALRSVAQSVAAHDDERGEAAEFDVFISHATEDKDAVARPVALNLQARGLRVWYDEFELRIGDSLRRRIDAGLARSRFGVIVLSPAFFKKNWPQYELDGLVSREMSGEPMILPLWHEISKDEVIRHSPSLADKVALSTAQYTIEEIAAEIAGVAMPAEFDRGI